MNWDHFLFDPADGRSWMVGPVTAAEYAKSHPHAVWRYNPWTGIGREPAEVAADPCGRRTAQQRTGRVNIPFTGTQGELDRRVKTIGDNLGKVVPGPVEMAEKTHDPVNHPKHYTSHPSGIEAIQVTRHMGFNVGNAMKYLWRADLKTDPIEDLKKAAWYIADEIAKRGS